MAFKLVNEDSTFDTMLAVAAYLGKKRIYRKDFEKLGVIEIEDEVEDVKDEPSDEQEEIENKPTDISDNGEDSEGTEEESDVSEESEKEVESETEAAGLEKDDILGKEYPNKEKEGKLEDPKKATPEYVLALREKAEVKTIEDLYKRIRGAKYEDVIKLSQDLGVFWDENPNPKINRMNVGKALRETLFPGEKRPHRPKSAWYGVPTEQIMALAEASGIEVRKAESDRVTRMWLTKELKSKGIEPPKSK